MATNSKSTLLAVVRASEVEHYSRMGWTLRQVVSHSEVEHVPEKQAFMPSGASYPVTLDVNRVLVVTGSRFLMARDGSLALEEKERELRCRLDDLTALRTLLDSQTAEAAQTTKALAAEREQTVRLDAELRRRKQELEGERQQKLKMEADIAKLRNALGELRMKEILG